MNHLLYETGVFWYHSQLTVNHPQKSNYVGESTSLLLNEDSSEAMDINEVQNEDELHSQPGTV